MASSAKAAPVTNGVHKKPTNPLVHDYPNPLKIAIIGAGIGGLSAAIGLRRQDHEVHIYEQSRLASESGAAVHIAPNSNGILRRWGIIPEQQLGAVETEYVREHSTAGELLKELPVGMHGKMFQHPWQLVHRVALHDKLKQLATTKDAPGIPAALHTSSKVVDVDCETGKLTLESGEIFTADVLVGADGIYSRTRKALYGDQFSLFSSGKAAYRFLLPRKVALDDPITRPLVEKLNTLGIWFSSDRRLVMYPCNDNETLNFVLIHPDGESHAEQNDEWSKRGSIDQMLKVYQDFDPAVKQLISKVDPAGLNVWRLMDMDKLSSWTKGRLALLGDAAHPFTPHQGQGAGQAMEDAAALATVLPKGTSPKDVAERLRLYEKIRYERAHTIQEFSRQAGKDWVDGKPTIDMHAYTNYNFGHDEIDNSAIIFKKWLWSQKKDLYWRMPLGFGPFPGPRQDHLGQPRPGGDKQTFVTTSIKFKTSRTYLESLFPIASTDAFAFTSLATVCMASISVTTLGNMAWLGGGGYNHLGLYVHGVEYTKQDGTKIKGTYLPVLFESLTDPIVSGRDELGMNKIYCDIDIDRPPTGYRARCSWRGANFLTLTLEDLQADSPSSEGGTIGGEADYGILTYKYIPAVGEPGKADVEYACVVPHGDETTKARVVSVARSSKASLRFNAGDWDSLPTLHHVSSALAQIPVYEIVSAKVVEGFGVPDVSACRRIE